MTRGIAHYTWCFFRQKPLFVWQLRSNSNQLQPISKNLSHMTCMYFKFSTFDQHPKPEHFNSSPGCFGSSQSKLVQLLLIISISPLDQPAILDWWFILAGDFWVSTVTNSAAACICKTDGGAGCNVSPSIIFLLQLWLIVIWRGWSWGVSESSGASDQVYCLVIQERYTLHSTKVLCLWHRSNCSIWFTQSASALV